MKILNKQIGPKYPTYIIAELSANHGQDIKQALELVDAAAEAKVDAVKLQTYTPDTITIKSDRPEFIIQAGTVWEGKTLYDLYGEAYTPWEWHPEIMEHARKNGLHCFSSPFDFSAVDFLESLNVGAYKIASFELVDLPLIEKVAKTGKPLIMSTGMATVAEISDAVKVARDAGCEELALLKCTSAYPAEALDINLRTLPDIAKRFEVDIGLSDHTLGIEASIVAVALGARIVEKHFTLSRNKGGPDSSFSLEPHEFKELVKAIRFAEQSLGKISYNVSPKEDACRMFRRSLYVVKAIEKGDVFTSEHVRSIRPANGIAPKYLPRVIGQKASKSIDANKPLEFSMIDACLDEG